MRTTEKAQQREQAGHDDHEPHHRGGEHGEGQRYGRLTANANLVQVWSLVGHEKLKSESGWSESSSSERNLIDRPGVRHGTIRAQADDVAGASVNSVSSGRTASLTWTRKPSPRLMYMVRPGPTLKTPDV